MVGVMETGELKLLWNIGIGARGQVRRAVITVCEVNELEWDIQEEKGFLGSLFIIKIKGEVWKLKRVHQWSQQVVKDWNSA